MPQYLNAQEAAEALGIPVEKFNVLVAKRVIRNPRAKIQGVPVWTDTVLGRALPTFALLKAFDEIKEKQAQKELSKARTARYARERKASRADAIASKRKAKYLEKEQKKKESKNRGVVAEARAQETFTHFLKAQQGIK